MATSKFAFTHINLARGGILSVNLRSENIRTLEHKEFIFSGDLDCQFFRFWNPGSPIIGLLRSQVANFLFSGIPGRLILLLSQGVADYQFLN